MLNNVLRTAVTALGLIFPGFVHAATITSITGEWSATDPVVSGVGSNQILWGQSAGYGQSGYLFESAETPFEVFPGSNFLIGTFTHLNKPIRGTLLREAELTVSFFFDGLAEAVTSVFLFDHLETHNEAQLCANGGSNYSGVNKNGCADRVGATLNEERSDTIEIDGISYFMDLSGFEYGGSLFDYFWTEEKKDNEAVLVGVLRAASDQPLPPVPLPASGFLLFGALAALGYARSKNSRDAATS